MSSIRDVAKQAGVSPATVSRILNNNQVYKTSPETRERVLKAVTALDYKPLVHRVRNASPAAGSQGMRAGCLLASTRGKYSDPFYLDILDGFEKEFERLGGSVPFVRTEQDLDKPEIFRSLLDLRLDGLIMMRPLSDALFTQLRRAIPHIVGIDTGHMPIDNIEYDHLRVSRMAVEYLYAKGYRRIGYIGAGVGPVPLERCRRYRSYRETMTDLGLEIRPEWVLDCHWDDKRCMELVEKTCRTVGLPEAFYAASDLMAMAALREFYQLGLRVPKDVAIIGMSNIEMSQYANPPLTTIDVPTGEIGIAAARALAGRIRGDNTLPKRILLPSTLIERDTV